MSITLQKRFTDLDVGFQHPLNVVKIALVFLAETFIVGYDYKKKVLS